MCKCDVHNVSVCITSMKFVFLLENIIEKRTKGSRKIMCVCVCVCV